MGDGEGPAIVAKHAVKDLTGSGAGGPSSPRRSSRFSGGVVRIARKHKHSLASLTDELRAGGHEDVDWSVEPHSRWIASSQESVRWNAATTAAAFSRVPPGSPCQLFPVWLLRAQQDFRTRQAARPRDRGRSRLDRRSRGRARGVLAPPGLRPLVRAGAHGVVRVSGTSAISTAMVTSWADTTPEV